MIHFITPLYRYNNIKRMYINILPQISEFRWHLIEGSNSIGDDDLDFLKNDERVKFYKIETKHIWGHEQRNYFISNIPADDLDWCYFLDDDNMITGDLVDVYNTDGADPNLDIILFSQKAGMTDKIRIIATGTNNLRCGGSDIGSYLVRYRLIKNISIPYETERNGDGHFAEWLRTLVTDINFKVHVDKYVRYNVYSKVEIF